MKLKLILILLLLKLFFIVSLSIKLINERHKTLKLGLMLYECQQEVLHGIKGEIPCYPINPEEENNGSV